MLAHFDALVGELFSHINIFMKPLILHIAFDKSAARNRLPRLFSQCNITSVTPEQAIFTVIDAQFEAVIICHSVPKRKAMTLVQFLRRVRMVTESKKPSVLRAQELKTARVAIKVDVHFTPLSRDGASLSVLLMFSPVAGKTELPPSKAKRSPGKKKKGKR